jgi:hypothetical protein
MGIDRFACFAGRYALSDCGYLCFVVSRGSRTCMCVRTRGIPMRERVPRMWWQNLRNGETQVTPTTYGETSKETGETKGGLWT